jgi:hypothetical protein
MYGSEAEHAGWQCPKADCKPSSASSPSHGWTCGWWALASALALTGAGSIWAGPAAVAFYIGGAGVFVGGIAMTAMHFGRAGLVDLGRRIIDPRPIGPAWWASILLYFPLLTLAASLVAIRRVNSSCRQMRSGWYGSCWNMQSRWPSWRGGSPVRAQPGAFDANPGIKLMPVDRQDHPPQDIALKRASGHA